MSIQDLSENERIYLLEMHKKSGLHIYPDNLNTVLVNQQNTDETNEIGRVFGGRKWYEITDEDLGNWREYLLLLHPIAFFYYLPRFIEYGLKNKEKPVIQKILSRLTPPRKPQTLQRFLTETAYANDYIKELIKEFLNLILKLDNEVYILECKLAARCLGNYWGNI